MKKGNAERVPFYRRFGGGVLYAAICLSCIGGVFALYRLEQEALWYALLLCVFIGFIFLIIGYIAERRRAEKLRFLRSNLTGEACKMPIPRTREEAEYQALIRTLLRENMHLAEKHAQTLRTLNDDYTLWAHQIKTPIAALKLLLAAREDENAREEELELMRIEDYVQMALSVQRLSGDSSDLYPKEVALEPIVRKVVKKYARLFIRKHLYLHFEPLHARVITDEKWLSFILEQLLTNALKYTQTGGIDIFFENSALVIRDSGVGIAKEDLPRIFERGYTGYNGRAEGRATGMGLYLCKKAADMLGHGLTIESQLGEGASVRIVFGERLRVE